MIFLLKLFWLLFFHALFDYQLQLEPIASHKSPRCRCSDHEKLGPWWWAMSAHAMLNAGGVYWTTGILWLGGVEFALHFALDTYKCLGWINTSEDQWGHFWSKVGYAVIAVL